MSDTNQKSNKNFTQKIQSGTSTTFTKKKKKHRNKKKSHTVAQRPAVKEYVSKCCNLPAKKPRTGSELGVGRGSKDKDTTQVHGLGGWRCSGCSKPAKVTPQAIKPKEEPIAQQ